MSFDKVAAMYKSIQTTDSNFFKKKSKNILFLLHQSAILDRYLYDYSPSSNRIASGFKTNIAPKTERTGNSERFSQIKARLKKKVQQRPVLCVMDS